MKELEPLVAAFANKLSALLQRHVNEALGGTRASHTAAGNSKPRATGGKRSAVEMEQLRTRLLRVIDDNPGRRTEQINATLGTTTKDIALPLRQLIAEKLVKTEGERRGTRYFTTSKGSKA